MLVHGPSMPVQLTSTTSWSVHQFEIRDCTDGQSCPRRRTTCRRGQYDFTLVRSPPFPPSLCLSFPLSVHLLVCPSFSTSLPSFPFLSFFLSFLPSFLPSFFPSFFHSFLPSFLPSFPPSSLPPSPSLSLTLPPSLSLPPSPLSLPPPPSLSQPRNLLYFHPYH